MPYKKRIKSLEESHKLIDQTIAKFEKDGNADPKKLTELRETRSKYMAEIRTLNRAQWEHDHESVDFGDDR